MPGMALDYFEWFDDGDWQCWKPPEGYDSVIDWAGLAQIEGARPGQPRMGVIGYYSGDPPKGIADRGGFVLSGEDPRDTKPDGKALDAYESITGYRPQGDTLAALIVDHFTLGADPVQAAGPGLIVPNYQRKLRWFFANGKVPLLEKPFAFGDDPAYDAKLLDLLKRDLTAKREQALDGQLISATTKQVDEAYHLRIADALVEKYAGTDQTAKDALWVELKPDDWGATENPLKHGTTITDNFNRGNQAGLGSSSEGWSWAAVVGTQQIVSNRAQFSATNNNTARAESDLASADHSCQCDRIDSTTTPSWVGPATVYSASATTHYLVVHRSASSPGFYKCATGSFTLLNPTITAEDAAHTYKLNSSGGNHEWFRDGVSEGTQSDSAITGNTRCGLYIARSGNIADNWSAADLAATTLNPSRLNCGGNVNWRDSAAFFPGGNVSF